MPGGLLNRVRDIECAGERISDRAGIGDRAGSGE
jgi:hypothetical protein